MVSKKTIMACVICLLAVGAVIMVALSRTKADKAQQQRTVIELEQRLGN